MEEIDEKKKRKYIILISILLVLLYVAIFAIVDRRQSSNREKEEVEIVTNYSEFYTVDACANKYMTYLSSRNSTALLNILNSNFKKTNHVTQDNVLDILPIVSSGSAFTTKEMYRVQIKENLYKYYLKGFIEVGGMDITDRSRTEGYLIIYLDKENTLFSAEPYDGTNFKDGGFE